MNDLARSTIFTGRNRDSVSGQIPYLARTRCVTPPTPTSRCLVILLRKVLLDFTAEQELMAASIGPDYRRGRQVRRKWCIGVRGVPQGFTAPISAYSR